MTRMTNTELGELIEDKLDGLKSIGAEGLLVECERARASEARLLEALKGVMDNEDFAWASEHTKRARAAIKDAQEGT